MHHRALLALTVACQLATLLMTWPLWQRRSTPPNLPLFSWLPEISFGPLMAAGLVLVLWRPRLGVFVHWITLLAACCFDQFRLSPQFFGIAFLMTACLNDEGTKLCRWYLVAMWTWAGLHKLLSPDWFGHVAWSLVEQAGADPSHLHLPFALTVAVTELTLGLLMLVRPRWAAQLCLAVHLGIALFLSPLLAGINYSVLPWNFCLAVVGCWIGRKVSPPGPGMLPPTHRWEKVVAMIFLIVPAGFYGGWVDRCFCHVL
ncbi:MAG: hypothetical protein MI861_17880, partial [Pirellulales bacterium]|nr:hypothetical protein [Pirellulales bacterium]